MTREEAKALLDSSVPEIHRTPNAAERAFNRLPDAMAAVGGMMGAPFGPAGRVANATRMGLAGRGITHVVNAARGVEPSWSMERIGEEAKSEALRHAGTQAIGEGIAGAVAIPAKPLMANAMGNPVIREGVDAVKSNLDKVRVPIGRLFGFMDRFGARQGREAVSQSSKVLRDHLAQLDAAGHAVDGTAAIDRAYQKLSSEFNDSSGHFSQQQLDNLYNETIAKHGSAMTTTKAARLKSYWDKMADPIHRAIEQKQMVAPDLQVRAKWDKALADELRDAVEQESARFSGAATGKESAARQINAVTRERMQVLNEVQRRENQRRGTSPVLGALGALGAASTGHGTIEAGLKGAGGMLAAHTLSQPEVTSRLALLLTDPITKAVLRNAPRAAVAAQTYQAEGQK